MGTETTKVMGWGTILGLMLATALVMGMLFGLVTSALNLPGHLGTVGVGAATGVVGAVLMARRRAALAAGYKP